jgi:UDP-N-acetylglucosamine 4,6-dehydratase/5-epimerase
MIKKNKIYVITGACGFLGKELTKRVISQGGLVKTMCLNEEDSINIKKEFGDSIETIIGDIKNGDLVNELITKDVEGVFHLAAFKYVGLAETETLDCINSNVMGTINVLNSSANSSVDFVLCTSTAAAVNVSGVYGASKMLMEKLFHQYQRENENIKFRIIRYGNIIYSTGSVLCKWKDAIINNKDVIITDEDSTRFFTTLEESVDLIYDCLLTSIDSSPYIPNIKSMRMGDMLGALIYKYSNIDYTPSIKIIGLQLGENKHEILSETGLNSSEVEKFTKEEIIKLI